MQTNRINGEATIDLLNKQVPTSMVGLNARGTPNHKLEAAAVAIGCHCLLKPDKAQGDLALKRAIELLELQLTDGHMTGEVFTDSHAPIWLRAATSLRLWTLRLLKRGSANPLVLRLDSLTQGWFEHHYSCLSLGLVPRGPLAGQVILPCNRKSKQKTTLAVILPGDMVRNVWMGQVNGTKVKVGRDFWQISKDRQDTLAGPLTKLILAEGGFGSNLKRGTLPKLCAPFVLRKFENGFEARFPDGLPGQDAWSATSCWVEYDSGRFAFDGSAPPFAGLVPKKTVRLAAAI